MGRMCFSGAKMDMVVLNVSPQTLWYVYFYIYKYLNRILSLYTTATTKLITLYFVVKDLATNYERQCCSSWIIKTVVYIELLYHKN